MAKGYLILESGDLFEGEWAGNERESAGEVVFNTSMTGYQEILTDPSYAGQIMTFCYPLIGNYGINACDEESATIHLSGAVINELCQRPSHFMSSQTLVDYLNHWKIPCLTGIDTRAIVKKIRKNGVMRGVLTSDPSGVHSYGEDAHDLVKRVTSKAIKTYDGGGPHIVLIDFGSKKSILNAFLQAGCKVTVVPYQTPVSKIKELKPDGLVLSNGPGDPTHLAEQLPKIKKLSATFPTLGICLGHQLIALAYGAETQKLRFGHRGANHPVKELETGKVWMTPQNHGYVVTGSSINEACFTVTYRHVNDGTVEGMKHKKFPIETVQFHPEAHAGPCDTQFIFTRFLQKIEQLGDLPYAVTF
ncbi:carbamoyl phosphate synthase small subunit [Camelliibacillus cellulosilyticus]|uniref:Carbamoyl phosphate synthase small chain n=1 Tax=Camelliibacillus cellulosilyticus TaxID=2174486 RepID=A0ABV9GKP1_9BACL